MKPDPIPTPTDAVTRSHAEPPSADTTAQGEAASPAPTATGVEHLLRMLAASDSDTSTETGRTDPPPGFAVERELGSGGMGVVYLARQQGLNRPVALKLVKGGGKVGGKALIRFLAEAEAVAAVRHPNVVEVYQYGEHAGRPYLALEYCPGGDLTTLTKAEQTRDDGWFRKVAELVAGVADGVQAAHVAGIVHRDLKPHNVLLAADGTPKVADFGLAKRGLGSDLTHTGAVLGTPAYMAPEQASGGLKYVGPEADVWALGAILYELACGERPIDTTGPQLNALARVAWGEVPPLRSRCPAVPPDLARVVHKCLSRDPRDRYPTAGGLAADLRNWRDGKPISARPVGAVESALKWARRNPRAAGIAAAVAAGVILATWISTWQALRATREANRATQEAVRAENSATEAVLQKERAETSAKEAAEQAFRGGELTAFLQSVFNAADPSGLIESGLMPGGQGGGKVPASELLARGAKLIRDERFQGADRGTRLTRATLLAALGEASRAIGKLEEAEPLLREALAIRQELLSADHPDLMASRFHLANWLTERGDLVPAEGLYDAVLDAHRRAGTLDTLPAAHVRLRLCGLYMLTGDERDEETIRAVLATRQRHLSEGHRDTALARLVLAGVHFGKERVADGLNEMKAAFATLNAGGRLANDPTMAAILDYQTGLIFRHTGFLSAAADKLRESARKGTEVLGPNHLYLTLMLGELGYVLRAAGKPAEAEQAFKDCLRVVRATVGVEHPKALLVVTAYAELLNRRGAKDEAWAILNETYQRSTARHGPTVRWRFPLLAVVVQAAVQTGRHAEAAALVDEMLAAFRTRPESQRRADGTALANTGQDLGELSDLTACRKVYEVVLALPTRQAVPESRWSDVHNFGTALARKGFYQEAAPHLRESANLIASPEVQGTKDYGVMAYSLASLGEVEWHAGNHAEAEKRFREAVGYDLKVLPVKERSDERLALLVRFLLARGQLADARPAVAEYLKLPGLTAADRAWGLFVQAATAEPGPEQVAALKATEALPGTVVVPDVALYRALSAVVAGGDAGREAERLDAVIAAGKPGVVMLLARAACALTAGNPDDATAALAAIKTDLKDTPRGHLFRLLTTAAAHRKAPTDQTLADLRRTVTDAEKHLDGVKRGTTPGLKRVTVIDLLNLRIWCARLRGEQAPTGE